MDAYLSELYLSINGYNDPNKNWKSTLLLTIPSQYCLQQPHIKAYNYYFQTVSDLSTDYVRRCLISVIILGPLFQRDVVLIIYGQLRLKLIQYFLKTVVEEIRFLKFADSL